MKRTLLLILLTGLLSCSISISAKTKDRIIDQPFWNYSSTQDLELKKIILTDTATIFCFRVNCVYRPWSMQSGVHLEANGKNFAYRYGKLVSTHTKPMIESPFSPDSTYTSKHTKVGEKNQYDKDSLVICFNPLPTGTEYVDFIEGQENNSWKIFRIKLDGKPFPYLLPKQTVADTPLPEYTPKAGKAVLKGRIFNHEHVIEQLGFGCVGNDYSLTGDPFDIRMEKDSLGNIRFETSICHPIPLRFYIPGEQQPHSVILLPGEEVEFQADIAAMASQTRNIKTKNKAYQFNGKYAPMNEVLNENHRYTTVDYLINLTHITFNEFAQDLWETYQKDMKDANENPQYNAMQREFLQLKTQANYANNYIKYIGNIKSGFYFDNKKADSLTLSKYQAQFTLKDPHAKELNLFDNLKALYVIYDYNLMDYMKANGLDKKEVYQWMEELKKAKELSSQINLMKPVTDAAVWKSIAPEYVSALQQLNDTIIKKMKAMENLSTKGKVKEVPNVSGEQLIQSIVDQYKGKVVLIDCWATWCGPCQTGIKKMEPMKEELAGKDVVFVYLTNESSDAVSWMKKVEEIKGDHYRISKGLWDKIPNVEAIPHYFIFDRNGKKISDEEGWSDKLLDEFKSTILKALEP